MRGLYVRWGHLKSLRAALQLDVMMDSECVLCLKVLYKHLKLNPPIPLFDVTEVFWCTADLFCKHLLSHSYAFSTSSYIKTNAFIVYRHAVLQRSVMIQSISNFIVLILETNLNDISDYINMGDNI